MEYYSRQEYNKMKRELEKKANLLNKKVESLTKELKKVKEDYRILLETATEKEESEDRENSRN